MCPSAWPVAVSVDGQLERSGPEPVDCGLGEELVAEEASHSDVVRQLVWTRAAPAAWDHLGGVVEVGGVMMAGGAVDVKSGSVRPPSRSRRVAADGPAVGPGRMVRGGSDLSEWEGRFGPDGLGVGVPTMMPVVAVGGLAGDAESVADVGPAGAPVEGPGDRCVEGVLGSLFGGCGVDGGGECVGAESFGAVHQGCHLRVTR